MGGWVLIQKTIWLNKDCYLVSAIWTFRWSLAIDKSPRIFSALIPANVRADRTFPLLIEQYFRPVLRRRLYRLPRAHPTVPLRSSHHLQAI